MDNTLKLFCVFVNKVAIHMNDKYHLMIRMMSRGHSCRPRINLIMMIETSFNVEQTTVVRRSKQFLRFSPHDTKHRTRWVA